MAEEKKDKPKPITRAELAEMSREDIQRDWAKIKRRLKVSIPDEAADGDDGDQVDDEKLTPRQRMDRGHQKFDEAREAGQKGVIQ